MQSDITHSSAMRNHLVVSSVLNCDFVSEFGRYPCYYILKKHEQPFSPSYVLNSTTTDISQEKTAKEIEKKERERLSAVPYINRHIIYDGNYTS